jgi:hypothetical protein
MDGTNILDLDDARRDTFSKVQQTNWQVVYENFKTGIDGKFVSNQIPDVAIGKRPRSASQRYGRSVAFPLALTIDPEIERHQTAIRLKDGCASNIAVAPCLDLIFIGKAERAKPFNQSSTS